MSSSAVPRAGSGSIPDRLSVGALGLALVLLVSVAWGTGLFYLIARLGLPAPVRLAWIDALHMYVGFVGAVFIVGKVLRVGLRYRVRGVPSAVPWQRWMSWSLVALYGVIFVSGVLVLLPIPGRVYSSVVELHLLTSVWALVPTSWHVWHYRSRATPFLVRIFRRARGRRFWLGIALAMAPAAILLTQQPPALSQLSQVMAGSTWTPAGLKGVPISHLTPTADGSTLLAAGDKMYTSHDGKAWTTVASVPSSGFIPVQPGGPGQHVHPASDTTSTIIQSLAVGRDGIYAGTAEGLFLSPAPGSPFVNLGFPAADVETITVDPANPLAVWTASLGGPMLSSDGGHTWVRLVAGLQEAATVSAITYLGGRVFAADATGVFQYSPASGSWVRLSTQPQVIALTASPDGRALYAASSTSELRVLENGVWQTLGTPGTAHLHGGQLHGTLRSVLMFAGRLYAAGTTDGVSASDDGGQTWTQLGGGIANSPPGQVVAFHGQLWAATSNGIYRYVLTSAAPATPTWWAGLVAAAVAVGSLALAVLGLDRGRPASSPEPGRAGAPAYRLNTATLQAAAAGSFGDRPFLGVETYMASVVRVSPEPAQEPPPPLVEPIVPPPIVPPTAPSEEFDRTRRLPRLTDLPETRVLRRKKSEAAIT